MVRVAQQAVTDLPALRAALADPHGAAALVLDGPDFEVTEAIDLARPWEEVFSELSTSRRKQFRGAEKRGMARRMSFSGSAATSGTASHKNPRATGLNATKLTPNSRQAAKTAISGFRVHREYSVCTAVIGCSLWALRKVVADTSDKPMVRILPSRTKSLKAPTLSSIGTLLSQRCR